MQVIEKSWGKQILDDEGQPVATIIKKRREFVSDEDFSLAPDTLVGSWFHVLVSGDVIWQGVVVAEPQAGRYLCQIDVLEQGAKQVQRVFSLDTIMGLGDEARRLLEGSMSDAKAPIVDPTVEWRLYDSYERAQEAYREWLVSREPADEAVRYD